ncbi:hypothetical protein VPH35_080670 [Triticum aestivum]
MVNSWHLSHRMVSDPASRLTRRRDALLVAEVVAGIHGRLHRRESPVVADEVALAPHLAALRRAVVLADVQVPEVDVRPPRVLAHVLLHEVVQAADPGRRRRAVASLLPEGDVLDDVQHAVPVRVRRRRGGDAAHEPAVRLQHHEPGAVLGEPGEDLLPRGLGDGAPDVVGLDLPGAALAGCPAQERLLQRAVAAEADEGRRRRLQPGHRLAVGSRHAQLRELVAHRRHQRPARAEVQRLEQRLLPLHDHPYGEVARERRRHVLPSGEDVHGVLVDRLGDVEHRHRRRDLHELDLPREHDAEVPAAAAPDGPEEVLPHAGPVQEAAVGVDQRGVEDLVGGEAVLAHHHADGAAAEVAAHADGGALAGREREPGVVLGNGVVQLPDGRARVDPGRGLEPVDAHGPEVGAEVDHREHLGGPHGTVREALVVVSAAAHAEAHAMPAAAEHGGLDVGGVAGRDDAERPRRGVGEELGVPDGGCQHVGEVGGALRVQELAGYLGAQAPEEAIGWRSNGAREEEAHREGEC